MLFQEKENEEIDPQNLDVDDWVLVEYDGTTFVGRVNTVREDQAEVLALSKKYGGKGPQSLEREKDAVWYEKGKIFKCPVTVRPVQVGRKYMWTYD